MASTTISRPLRGMTAVELVGRLATTTDHAEKRAARATLRAMIWTTNAPVQCIGIAPAPIAPDLSRFPLLPLLAFVVGGLLDSRDTAGLDAARAAWAELARRFGMTEGAR